MFIVLQCPFKGHLKENLMSTGITLHLVKKQMFLLNYSWDTSFLLKKLAEFTDCM